MKKGQIFSAYLLLITFFLTAISIVLFLSFDAKSIDSLVMPYDVLRVRDDLDIFEMQEDLILQDLKNINENEFCNVLMSDEEYYGFLFEDLYYMERDDWDFNPADRLKFCKDIYDISVEDGKISFFRAELGKKIFLFPSNNKKVSFPVGFEYFYKRQDLFSREDLE